LVDSFDDDTTSNAKYSLIQGGHLDIGCIRLVEDQGLHFSGRGQRLVETKDLDLRLAK